MILKLKKSSEADDLHCLDGELEGADYMFADGKQNDPNPGTAQSPTYTLQQEPGAVTLPGGAEFIAAHSPEKNIKNIIIKTAEGGAAWFDGTTHPLTSGIPKKVVGIGRWLAVLTSTTITYHRWNGTGYDTLGTSPAAPAASYSAAPKALPPYCTADGEHPLLGVSVAIGSAQPSDVLGWLAGSGNTLPANTRTNILDAVKTKFKEFQETVKEAGLSVTPVKVSTAWQLSDGTLWQQSNPRRFDPPAEDSDRLILTINNAECLDGTLRLELRFSRTPFKVESGECAIPAKWVGIIAGTKTIVTDSAGEINENYISAPVWTSGTKRGFLIGRNAMSDEEEPESSALAAMESGTLPADIFAAEGKLIGVTPEGEIKSSLTGLPPVCGGSGRPAGSEIIHLTQSLRSLSSGQFGQFPLYAFCRDGIRALTPYGGSYREVQLISRDVALGKESFAPLPDCTCFITSAGVMKIEGTSVTCLTKNVDRDYTETDRLLYLYKENALILYRSGEAGGMIYHFDKAKWSELYGKIEARHYAWPYALVQTGLKVGTVLTGETPMTAAAPEIPPLTKLIPIKTRPIKFGDPFALKKMTDVEAEWADGSRGTLKVYGALKLDKWYFLGMAPKGRMKMRGSGWRYFRIETFALLREGTYLLPQIKCTIL